MAGMDQYRRPLFGCAIGEKCRRTYSEPCAWDVLCVHYVVVGCFTKPDGRDQGLCVDCHRFPCDTRKERAALRDPDLAGIIVRDDEIVDNAPRT